MNGGGNKTTVYTVQDTGTDFSRTVMDMKAEINNLKAEIAALKLRYLKEQLLMIKFENFDVAHVITRDLSNGNYIRYYKKPVIEQSFFNKPPADINNDFVNNNYYEGLGYGSPFA